MTDKIALFLLRDRTFALPVDGILRIQPMERVFPLPRLRQGVLGVFLDQGEVVPLLDLAVFFGDVSGPVSALPAFRVVYGSEIGHIGLPADKVLQVVERDKGKVQEMEGDQRRAGVDAFFFYQGESYPLLLVDALLAALPS
jgi:chemotaxis signal transduction protein